jgi:hypothetical protein
MFEGEDVYIYDPVARLILELRGGRLVNMGIEETGTCTPLGGGGA